MGDGTIKGDLATSSSESFLNTQAAGSLELLANVLSTLPFALNSRNKSNSFESGLSRKHSCVNREIRSFQAVLKLKSTSFVLPSSFSVFESGVTVGDHCEAHSRDDSKRCRDRHTSSLHWSPIRANSRSATIGSRFLSAARASKFRASKRSPALSLEGLKPALNSGPGKTQLLIFVASARHPCRCLEIENVAGIPAKPVG